MSKVFVIAMGMMVATICQGAGAKLNIGETNNVIFASHFEQGLKGRWQQVTFFGLKPTAYAVVADGTNFCLRASATNSDSALMAKVNLKPSPHLRVSWRWKIDRTPPGASDRTLRDYDHAARVIIAFDTFIGTPRSIDYFWANSEPVGTAMSHPLSGRTQMLAVESGNARAGEWIAEERDVTADWQRLFPGRTMPKIEAIGVMTDSDSTHGLVSASYENIELDVVK
jgi:hypothetical protein